MEFTLKNEPFDTMIVPSDWRYSASIVGLVRFLEYFKRPYALEKHEIPGQGFSDRALVFRREDITEAAYLNFVEHCFADELQPCILETYLQQTDIDFSEDDIKIINELMTGARSTTLMKKIFAKQHYTPDTRESLLRLLRQHKEKLIKETYRNKRNLYYNFANPNSLGNDPGDACRLNGYYIDVKKKGKSQGYGFDAKRIDSEDSLSFDFIPFAFSGGRQTFFWNNSADIKTMIEANTALRHMMKSMKNEAAEKQGTVNELRVFWKFIIQLMEKRSFNVEVITKVQDEGYFKTLFIRKKSADVLKLLHTETTSGKMAYDSLSWSYPMRDGKTWLNFQQITMDAILNLAVLDNWIEYFLQESVRIKDWRKFRAVLYQWIRLNIVLRVQKGDTMVEQKKITSNVYIARRCAAAVSHTLPENKVNSYRAKLTSSLIYHDYERFCDTLLQLSNYTKLPFDFSYSLFTDFEGHKDVAYAFVEALDKNAGKSLEIADTIVGKHE